MKCVQCGKPDSLNENQKTCDKCGFVMYDNYCSNIYCIRNENDAIACDSGAKFCDVCGSKTLHYALGILKNTDGDQ